MGDKLWVFRTKLKMVWAILRGRSVMYRYKVTRDGIGAKTMGAWSVENYIDYT